MNDSIPGRPGIELCLLCGKPKPPRSWWKRLLFLADPPQHDPNGPDGDQCWIDFNKRLGIDDPGPKPS